MQLTGLELSMLQTPTENEEIAYLHLQGKCEYLINYICLCLSY